MKNVFTSIFLFLIQITAACGETLDLKADKSEVIVELEEAGEHCQGILVNFPNSQGGWDFGNAVFRLDNEGDDDLFVSVISYNQDELDDGDEMKTHPGYSTVYLCIIPSLIEKAELDGNYYPHREPGEGFIPAVSSHNVKLADALESHNK